MPPPRAAPNAARPKSRRLHCSLRRRPPNQSDWQRAPRCAMARAPLHGPHSAPAGQLGRRN
eukprot:5396298-Pyramimonas_sp.AAC.1